MIPEIIAKTILLIWMRYMIRLVLFNNYEIVFMLPIIIILDQIISPSSKKTSIEDTGSQTTGTATQEDPGEKKKTIINKGKEE
ncbi:hypothetical protein NPIL_432381, partial [Nephila pilipes]